MVWFVREDAVGARHWKLNMLFEGLGNMAWLGSAAGLGNVAGLGIGPLLGNVAGQ